MSTVVEADDGSIRFHPPEFRNNEVVVPVSGITGFRNIKTVYLNQCDLRELLEDIHNVRTEGYLVHSRSGEGGNLNDTISVKKGITESGDIFIPVEIGRYRDSNTVHIYRENLSKLKEAIVESIEKVSDTDR